MALFLVGAWAVDGVVERMAADIGLAVGVWLVLVVLAVAAFAVTVRGSVPRPTLPPVAHAVVAAVRRALRRATVAVGRSGRSFDVLRRRQLVR